MLKFNLGLTAETHGGGCVPCEEFLATDSRLEYACSPIVILDNLEAAECSLNTSNMDGNL